MSGGGGKGGGETQKTEIPDWLKQPAMRNIARAEQLAQTGYMPYYGPDVAAFTPMQEAAMQSTADAGAAFGLVPQGMNAMAGMPEAQTFDGGLRGYSSGGLFEQAQAELARRRPGQAQAYNQLFIDPYASLGGPEQPPPGLMATMGDHFSDPERMARMQGAMQNMTYQPMSGAPGVRGGGRYNSR